MVDSGHGQPKGLPELCQAAVPVHGGPLVVMQRGEGYTASLSRASPGRGRWCGDRAMVVKKRWWWCSVQAVPGHGEKRRRVGRGAVEDGGALPIYTGRGGGG
jgi:hypothetical protein